MSELTDKLLSAPTTPPAGRRGGEKDFTSRVEVSPVEGTAEVTLRDEPGAVTEGTAFDFLLKEGQDPSDWEVTGLRRSEWDSPNGERLESTRISFRRRAGSTDEERPPIDELIASVKKHKPKAKREQGDAGYTVFLGDTQWGKVDGDGVEGTLDRTITALDSAADQLMWYRKRWDIGHVHIGWLGDHIEGFVSQGGANAWRTGLTLNEQIRLTRRVMLHALETFAPLAERVTMAAVPGNHGEPQRFSGKGITRYDDSHDTESLVAVADAASLNPEAFGHVEFYVPDSDEMTVVLDIAGTRVGHVHGHQFRPGKQFDWWKGQAFGGSQLADADLLASGHLHHFHVDSDGPRRFVQIPALESESTWWRHKTGAYGDPGLVAGTVCNGLLGPLEVVR